MPRRLRFAAIHLLVSAVIAGLAAGVVFLVWYPAPLAKVAGGLGLFTILVSVDVVLGPMLTALVASAGKPIAELKRDIAIIAAVQLAAFAYGIHTMAVARPLYIVFAHDRFTVVSAADIDAEALKTAPPGYQKLPWAGPRWIAARAPANADEVARSLDMAAGGLGLALQGWRWTEFDALRPLVWKAARPVSELASRSPEIAAEVTRLAAVSGQGSDALRYLLLEGRASNAAVLLAPPDARKVGTIVLGGAP